MQEKIKQYENACVVLSNDGEFDFGSYLPLEHLKRIRAYRDESKGLSNTHIDIKFKVLDLHGAVLFRESCIKTRASQHLLLEGGVRDSAITKCCLKRYEKYNVNINDIITLYSDLTVLMDSHEYKLDLIYPMFKYRFYLNKHGVIKTQGILTCEETTHYVLLTMDIDYSVSDTKESDFIYTKPKLVEKVIK